MSANNRTWRCIELETQITGICQLHRTAVIGIDIEFNTRVLSGYGLSVMVIIVGESHQLVLLISIVPETALDDLAVFLILRHIAQIAVLHIDDEGIARLGFLAVAIQVPTRLHPAQGLANIHRVLS